MARSIHPSELIDPDFESMLQSYCDRNSAAKITSSSSGTSVLLLEESGAPAEEEKSNTSLGFDDLERIKRSFKRARKLRAI